MLSPSEIPLRERELHPQGVTSLREKNVERRFSYQGFALTKLDARRDKVNVRKKINSSLTPR